VLLVLSLLGNPLEGLWATLIVVPACYVVAAVPGAPVFFLFRYLGWDTVFGCMFCGFLCSWVATFYLMSNSLAQAMASPRASTWGPFVVAGILDSLFGVLTGFAFWRIASERSTDTST
jgi:hypothetical protein